MRLPDRQEQPDPERWLCVDTDVMLKKGSGSQTRKERKGEMERARARSLEEGTGQVATTKRGPGHHHDLGGLLPPGDKDRVKRLAPLQRRQTSDGGREPSGN